MIIGFVVGVFVVLQGLLICVGKVDSPVEAAVDFTKAYFMLDGASMSELLCREIVENEEVDLVGDYLNSVADAIKKRCVEKGLLLRPLGNVLYLMPPYCTTRGQLAEMYDGIVELLEEI